MILCLVTVVLIALYTSLHPWGCLLREQAWNIEIVFPSRAKGVFVFSLFLSKFKSKHAYCYLQKAQFP